MPELTKDESLPVGQKPFSESCSRYFTRFCSGGRGLLVTEARQAIYLIDPELTAEEMEWTDMVYRRLPDSRKSLRKFTFSFLPMMVRRV